ncbi:MAG: M48 family metalloprotease [Burkholderiales bacterium]|nr:M48 family metalloprotease [Burkholderiales bacterium]
MLTCNGALPQTEPVRSTGVGLPNLGDGSDMTPSAERRLGDRIARELYRDPDYIDDPVIMEYVQGIWQPLLAAARLRGELPPELDRAYAWEVLLSKDRTVNAFALPGAYLGLHLGLVSVVSSRDELASVLAHELSHVTQRHIARLLTRQSAQTPWMMGATILAVLAASKSAGAANAVIVGGQALAAQNQLNFSRDMEREADRVGYGVMTQAGFAPQAFVSMFEKLQQAARLNDNGNFPYLRSHPLTTERMADMQARIPVTDGRTSSALTMEHAQIAARARVLSNGNVDALRNWAGEVEPARLARLTPAAQAGALYGAALAAGKLRDFTAAQALMVRLEGMVAGNPAATRLTRLLEAELALAQDVPARALQILQSQPEGGRAVQLLQAQAAVMAGQAAQATQSLQTWLVDHPRDAMGWQLLASAYAAQGKSLSAVRAEAEVNIVQMDYAAALTRLKAAQDLARKGTGAGDYIEASIVDTRTRQVELWIREQALER